MSPIPALVHGGENTMVEALLAALVGAVLGVGEVIWLSKKSKCLSLEQAEKEISRAKAKAGMCIKSQDEAIQLEEERRKESGKN